MAKKEWKQRLIPKKALFRASLIWRPGFRHVTTMSV